MPFEEIISYGHIENQLMHPHRNRGMELVLVERGHLEWAVESRPEVLIPGSVFFTLPWQVHGSLSICEPKNRIYYVLFELAKPYDKPVDAVRFPKAFGFTSTEEKTLGRLFCGAFRHAWPSSETVRLLFPPLVRLLGSESDLDTSAAVSLLRALILEVARVVAGRDRPPVAEYPSVKRVRAFLRELGGRIDEPWTLNGMAEACGVRRTQFAKLCQRLSGYPPTHYLGRLRFEKACELLRETALSITDIAYRCGYQSSQYVAERFKKTARLSPSDYRKLSPQLEAILSAGWENPEWRTREEERLRSHILPSVDP